MSNAMRRYWVPVCLSSEIGEPDGAPMHVKLVGEELVAFRDTEGREHLGPADKAIIQARKLLREAVKAVEAGKQPAGTGTSYYTVKAGSQACPARHLPERYLTVGSAL